MKKSDFILLLWDNGAGEPGWWYVCQVVEWTQGQNKKPKIFIDTGGKNAQQTSQSITSNLIHFWKVCFQV